MCGRFEQSDTRRHYARYLGVDTSNGREWAGGDRWASCNIAPGFCPWMIALNRNEVQFLSQRWGYRTPAEAEEKKKPWINARIERALTGRYFRHMFREGRVIVPGGGWFEWTLESGTKQPWYIKRRSDEPIFMAGLTNFKPFTHQAVETGFMIVTQDSVGGMVDIHDRRPVVLEPADASRWMDPATSIEEAAHIAQTRSLPPEAFVWWRVDRALNRVDPYNNGKHLLAPIGISVSI